MRHDHTDWLIHFVRDRVPEQDFPGETEEQAGYYQGGELEADADAFSVLKTIIRLGGIMPGYAFRSGRTTIYGGCPAVCVTEMPLYSFAQYARSRGDTKKASAYGVAFLKSEFHVAGGRPVIYGLSTAQPAFRVNTATVRIFDDSVLPQAEQYRYVAYNPSTTGRWIDWSHEREWRWVPQDLESDEVWVQDYNGIYGPTPALPIFKGCIEGRPFTRVCIIVWTKDEADEIRRILTGFYMAGSNNYDTPFDRTLIKASRIIVLEDVVDAVENAGILQSQTIEGLEQADLLTPITITAPPEDADAIVQAAMDKAGAAAKSAVDAFRSKYGMGSGYCGFAHATTEDVTNPLVQYMLKNGLASGPYDGRVWINFPENYPPSQSMDYAEAGCRAAVEVLSAELGIETYCETRPD
jgi:hypothetical protein